MFFVGLEIIQGCVQATGEAFVTPLAFPILDVFLLAAFAIPAVSLGDAITDECVDTLIGDAEIVTLGIGTGVTFGGDALLAATGAFAFSVGDNIRVGLQDC
jgi:hypothetical protein